MIEADHEAKRQSLVEYMRPRNYHNFGAISYNTFFAEASFRLPDNLHDLKLSIDLTNTLFTQGIPPASWKAESKLTGDQFEQQPVTPPG